METNLSTSLPDSYRMPLCYPYFGRRRSLDKKSETIPHYAKASHLAKQLGLCSRTLFRWAATGKITRYKINARMVLFDRKEVMAFAKQIKGSAP